MNQMNSPTDQTTNVPTLSPKQKVFYSTGCAYELTKWLIVLIVLGTLIHFYVGTIFIVDGQSMEPNFHSGEYVIVNRFQYNFGLPERGDAVVLKFPGDPEHDKYIKRIVGLPGEKISIKDGRVYINDKLLNEAYIPDQTITYPDLTRILQGDDYFLMGDNRLNSSDSRIWGICPKRDLIGKSVFILFPTKFFGAIEKY